MICDCHIKGKWSPCHFRNPNFHQEGSLILSLYAVCKYTSVSLSEHWVKISRSKVPVPYLSGCHQFPFPFPYLFAETGRAVRCWSTAVLSHEPFVPNSSGPLVRTHPLTPSIIIGGMETTAKKKIMIAVIVGVSYLRNANSTHPLNFSVPNLWIRII